MVSSFFNNGEKPNREAAFDGVGNINKTKLKPFQTGSCINESHLRGICFLQGGVHKTNLSPFE